MGEIQFTDVDDDEIEFKLNGHEYEIKLKDGQFKKCEHDKDAPALSPDELRRVIAEAQRMQGGNGGSYMDAACSGTRGSGYDPGIESNLEALRAGARANAGRALTSEEVSNLRTREVGSIPVNGRPPAAQMQSGMAPQGQQINTSTSIVRTLPSRNRGAQGQQYAAGNGMPQDQANYEAAKLADKTQDLTDRRARRNAADLRFVNRQGIGMIEDKHRAEQRMARDENRTERDESITSNGNARRTFGTVRTFGNTANSFTRNMDRTFENVGDMFGGDGHGNGGGNIPRNITGGRGGRWKVMDGVGKGGDIGKIGKKLKGFGF